MTLTATKRGTVTYDNDFGHVCTCTKNVIRDDEGQIVYSEFESTVFAVKDCESPTESGSYWYSCSRCGAGAWSGM